MVRIVNIALFMNIQSGVNGLHAILLVDSAYEIENVLVCNDILTIH